MKTLSLLTLGLFAVCGGARADVFTLNSSTGVWSSVTPTSGVTSLSGVGTNKIRWGSGSPQSGYDYNGIAPPPVPESTETQFLIGSFVHHNNPIGGTSIDGATLDITLNMMFGATNVIKTFEYNFEHVETPNSNPCQFGAADGATNTVPCDDRVRVLNSIPDQTFTVGSTLFTLDLIGFSKNGGTTVSDKFFTTEGMDNTAQLYGKITSNFTTSAVPEPSSILLLITAIAGAGFKAAKSRLRRP